MEKRIASDLIALKAAIEAVDLSWCITSGIVLGYARYNAIMAWDTDIDAGIFVEVDDEKWQVLKASLRIQGFGIGEKKDDFLYGRRKVKLNLWFYHRTEWYYEGYPESTPGIKFVLKRQWFDEPVMVEFLGSIYPMPNHLDDYLIYSYGGDWKTNVIKDHEEYFKLKRGKRNDFNNWPEHSEKTKLWPQIRRIE